MSNKSPSPKATDTHRAQSNNNNNNYNNNNRKTQFWKSNETPREIKHRKSNAKQQEA